MIMIVIRMINERGDGEDEVKHHAFIPHICHPRHPRRQCKNVKVRGIFSILNAKVYTQCVILNTVCNFTHCV